jgi:NAD(P)-dependent dehydrogenase (short-subunit alcohol dehydrogenase family)
MHETPETPETTTSTPRPTTTTQTPQRLQGRVAAITGGASGIGKASAFRFLQEGASVVVADLHRANGEAFLKEAASLGFDLASIRFIRANVSFEDEVAAIVDMAVESFGTLDIMFNNAGIGGAFGSVTDLRIEDWDETFNVVARGVFLGVKHAAKQMIIQGGGSIINTASVAGITGGGGPVAYSAAKAAVINFTRAVSIELAEHRIRINAIAPGAIRTPLLEQGRKAGSLDDAIHHFQPWPAQGQPANIAATAAFLASDDASFITGECITVDGGLLASGPISSGIYGAAPSGWVGMNRGNTGQGATIHQRGERP